MKRKYWINKTRLGIFFVVLAMFGILIWFGLIYSKPNILTAKTINFSMLSYPSISFTYPNNWIIVSQSRTYAEIDSPSRKISIKFNKADDSTLSIDSCNTSNSSDVYLSYATTKLTNYSNLVYEEAIFQYSGKGGYSYEAKLLKNTNASDNGMIFKPVCRFNNLLNINNLWKGVVTRFNAQIIANDFFTENGGNTNTVSSINEIDKLFKSPDFIVARNILLSGKK